MSKANVAIAITAALAAAVVAVVAIAQAPADATYRGAKICKMCHSGLSGVSPAIVQAYDKSAHSKAFADASETPAAIVAEFPEGAPIKKEQIKYVLGLGRTAQAYLDANQQVLPAQWNVADKKWEATEAVDGSKQCVGCHTTGYDVAAKTWAQPSVGCEACHGPGSAHAGTGDKTKITNPKSLPKDRLAMVCGRCHSKGTDPTKTYAFPIKFRPGDDLSKVFVDAKPTTPGRNQQYSELVGSKHFGAGVICTTCHDPHGVGTTQLLLRKPITDLCLGCHADKDMKTHAPNAPAGATCATCHMPGGAHTFKAPH